MNLPAWRTHRTGCLVESRSIFGNLCRTKWVFRWIFWFFSFRFVSGFRYCRWHLSNFFRLIFIILRDCFSIRNSLVFLSSFCFCHLDVEFFFQNYHISVSFYLPLSKIPRRKSDGTRSNSICLAFPSIQFPCVYLTPIIVFCRSSSQHFTIYCFPPYNSVSKSQKLSSPTPQNALQSEAILIQVHFASH